MAKKLLVEGLDWGVGDAELRSLFAPFGRVIEAKVATDWETGRSRGFGHVTYDDETSARLALETMDGTSAFGKVIRVMEAPATGRRNLYRGGDYGRTGGDEGRHKDGSARVYRSADFGYTGGPTKKSTYRAADFDGPGRPRPEPKPAPEPEQAPPPESQDAAPPATADEAPQAPAPKGPKRAGGHRDAKKGWEPGSNEGFGDGGKTFG